MNPFIDGLLAGYGIAIPVGAIAILIVDLGLRQGFRAAFIAGSGAASADLIYASVAVLAGELVASALAPYAQLLKVASAAVLILIGARGLRRARRLQPDAPGPVVEEQEPTLVTFARFLGLTLMNPQTIAYFAALILGRESAGMMIAKGQIAFVVAAALASWSWQSVLALLGAVARHRLGRSFQRTATVLGNLLVLALGLRVVVELIG